MGWSLIAIIGSERLAALDAAAWAAWVQAVGSIGAILAAAWVVRFQHRLERERSREAELSAYRSQLQLAYWIATAVLSCCDRAKDWIPTADKALVRAASRAMSGELMALQRTCSRVDPALKAATWQNRLS